MKDDRIHTGSHARSFGRAADVFADPIARAVAFVASISLIFVTFPEIDPWFSGLFYDPGEGFSASRLETLKALRATGEWLVIATVIVLIVALAIKLARPERPAPIPPSNVLFLFATLAVGPGLLVNALLKEHWGRPRPAIVEFFGGDVPFVPVWQISDHCLRNCSFVSGEAAAAMWLVVAAAVIAPLSWRRTVVALLLLIALMLSLNRIAFGRHFLSDVLLAWGLTLVVIAVAHRILVERPPEWLSGERLEDGLTKLGLRIRSRAGTARDRG